MFELCGIPNFLWEIHSKPIYFFSFLPIKHNIVLSNHSEFLSFLLGTGGRNFRSLQTSIVSVGESTRPMEAESYSPRYLIWPLTESCHTILLAIWLGMNFKDNPNTEKTLHSFLSCTCYYIALPPKKKTTLKIFVQWPRISFSHKKEFFHGFQALWLISVRLPVVFSLAGFHNVENVCSLCCFIDFLDITVK